MVGAEQTEDFWFLLRNLPHWEFELFLMAVVDGIILGVGWPLFKRWLHRHDEEEHPQCDVDVSTLSNITQRLQALEARASRHTQEVGE